jgi:hypothetical protein
MTVKMHQFGECLVSRQDAKDILHSIGMLDVIPNLDFTGVEVANHGFADELWKGLASKLPSSSNLANVELTGMNEYVKNCLEAGFATAISY